jgi:hypothetical protein
MGLEGGRLAGGKLSATAAGFGVASAERREPIQEATPTTARHSKKPAVPATTIGNETFRGQRALIASSHFPEFIEGDPTKRNCGRARESLNQTTCGRDGAMVLHSKHLKRNHSGNPAQTSHNFVGDAHYGDGGVFKS